MERKTFFTSQGKHISVVVTEPRAKTDKAIVLIHGFKGNKDENGTFPAAAKAFANAGFLVVRFDCMGNGESDGTTKDFTLHTCMQNTLDAVAFARALGAKRVGLLGHSLGGEIAVMCAEKAKAKAIVLWAPVTQSSFWKTRFTAEEKESFLRKGFANIWGKQRKKFVPIGKAHYVSVINTPVEKELPKLRAATLIVHGTLDYSVPIVQSQYSLAQIRAKKKLVVVKDADHNFVKDKAKFIAPALAWFRKHL